MHWDSHTNILQKAFDYLKSDNTLTFEELQSLFNIAARDGYMSDAEIHAMYQIFDIMQVRELTSDTKKFIKQFKKRYNRPN